MFSNAILSRSYASFVLAVSFMLVAGCSQSETADWPAALDALEGQGLTIVQEVEEAGSLRVFAGIANDRPVAVYVTDENQVIVGTRVGSRGERVDEATLEALVARPISDQTWGELERATWVQDGQMDAPRVIYTFSDANCPYCNRFWQAARPWVEAGRVQIRHIFVGVIRADSPAKAAAILGAPDPSAALTENERNFDQGGITPADNVPTDVRRTLDDHQMLMRSTGFRGTPGIVVRGDDGLIQKYSGMPADTQLVELLGPR